MASPLLCSDFSGHQLAMEVLRLPRRWHSERALQTLHAPSVRANQCGRVAKAAEYMVRAAPGSVAGR